MKQQLIPTHRMDTQAPLGIGFGYLEMTDEYDEIMQESKRDVVHRDDYYMFLFMETATATFIVDFEDMQLQGESVFYVRPGQVHFVTSEINAQKMRLSMLWTINGQDVSVV